MNPDILSRLFAAQGTQAQDPQWGPSPYARTPDYGGGQQMAMAPQQHHAGAAQQPLTLEQEPSDLWGQGGQEQHPMERMSSAPMGEMFGPNPSGLVDQVDDGSASLLQDDGSTVNWGAENLPPGAGQGSWLDDGQLGEAPTNSSAFRSRLERGPSGGRGKL